MHPEARPSITAALLDDSRAYWVPPHVAELDDVPNALHFMRDYASQSVPFVVRGACTSWEAVRKWDVGYLDARHGDLELTVSLTPNGHADAVTRGHFAQPAVERWTMRQLLANVARRRRDVVAYYSAQNSCLTDECGALCADVDFSSVAFARRALGVRESAVNLWIGDERSVTTCHADPFHNLYVVVRGAKRFELRPPCDAAVLPRPEWPDATWARCEDGEGWELVPDPGGRSTRWVPHGEKFAGEPLCVRVNAGDMLYLPPLWFHTVRQQDVTIAVNWWFDMSYGRDWALKQLFDNLGEQSVKLSGKAAN